MRVYMDHNATSPLRPSVKAAMVKAMDTCGNASSIHAEGRAVRKLMDDSREKLAFWLGCLPQMITFTAGGTEANNMALRGVEVERILISAVEHDSVRAAAKTSGKSVETIPVDHSGRVDLNALETMLKGGRALVSVMFANNETGVIQPIGEIATMVHSAGSLLHVDAVQAVGKHRVNFGLLGVDLMTVAAHKVGGPVGIGALIIRDGLVVEPLLHGGGQELRRRAGTENGVNIAGFAALAGEADIDTNDLNNQLENGLVGATVFGHGAERLCNTTCFAFPGLHAETLVMKYDLDGIAVSSGSACSSGKVTRSHVLEAMGIEAALASGAIRVSLGWNSTQADVNRFLTITHNFKARVSAKAA